MLHRALALSVLLGCGSDLRYHTQAFTAPTTCGQGPYEVTVAADGTTAVDGLELIACTPRQLAGHTEVWLGSTMEMSTFGDTADNQRCVGGSAVVVESGASSATSSSTGVGGSGSAVAAQPVLVSEVFRGEEGDPCAAYGTPAQHIADFSTRRTTGDNLTRPGSEMSVRFWSAVPNDLDGVVFLVRKITSTKPPKQLSKDELAREAKAKADDQAQFEKELASARRPQTSPSAPQPTAAPWRAPPPPLAEEKPARTSESASWVPGYWKWTGTDYGWIAGFWRDAADIPAPRVEMPGDAPQVGAIWIGGTWRRSAGGWTWIGGRWRAR